MESELKAPSNRMIATRSRSGKALCARLFIRRASNICIRRRTRNELTGGLKQPVTYGDTEAFFLRERADDCGRSSRIEFPQSGKETLSKLLRIAHFTPFIDEVGILIQVAKWPHDTYRLTFGTQFRGQA